MMGEVLAAELPQVIPAVLSGPSFAADVGRGLPAALTISVAVSCARSTGAATIKANAIK